MVIKRSISLVPQRPKRIAVDLSTFHHMEPSDASSGVEIPHSETQKYHNSLGNGHGGRGAPPLGVGPRPPLRPKTGISGKENESTELTRSARVGRVAALDSTKVDLARVLELAEQLNPTERKQVLDHLALQSISTKTDHDRDIAMWSVSVHRALLATLGGLDMAAQGVLVVKRLLSPTAIWRPVADLATALGMEKLPVSERQYAFDVLAQVLMRYAQEASHRSGAPLTIKLVVNCCGNIGAAFDGAFPGYISGGVGPLLFNMMRKSLMAQDRAKTQTH